MPPSADGTTPGLAAVIGLEVGFGSVLVMLAGSDIPPPTGFWWVVLACAGLGAGTWLLVPRLMAMSHGRRSGRALLLAALAGAAYLALVALFLSWVGEGEPSIPEPSAGQVGILLAVCATVGAVGGALVGGVALTAGRIQRPAWRWAFVLGLPAILVAGALGLIALAVL